MVNNVDIIIVVCAIGQLDSVYMVCSASILAPAFWLLSIYYLTNHSTFVRDNILNCFITDQIEDTGQRNTLNNNNNNYYYYYYYSILI
jgi:hypothetical protein